jgi:hypothetical protein
MQSAYARSALALVLGTLAACSQNAQRSTDARGTRITAAEATELARDAYIFGLPPVFIEAQIDSLSHVSRTDAIRAPINQFKHHAESPNPSNRTIVGFNVDTLYSLAQLDLAPGPMVLSIPAMGDRYWLMQLLDAWNNVPHAPGSRTVGGAGGTFAIVGPGWQGTLPEGMVELRMPTTLAMLAGRTYTSGGADLAVVRALQQRFALVPLAAWGRPYTPPVDVPLKPNVDADTPVPEQIAALPAEEFFRRLNRLLVRNPPYEADRPVMNRIARLGIAPGAAFSTAVFTPEIRAAIDDGVTEARQVIRETPRGRNVNGWDITLDMGRYGTNYRYRAAWTFFGVGGNLAEDAVYPTVTVDGAGGPLDGARRYLLRFTRDQLPPVNAFWSIAVFDKDAFLVPNPINRYALSDRSGLRYASDGSLTIYIQRDAPGQDRDANWLPSPREGGMILALRLYAPRRAVIDGVWTPPPVVRTP